MLFDLRSRGRRRTMQVIYIGLAVLMAAGLVLFGVGTGTGGGGLFGGLVGSNSSNNGSGAVANNAKHAQQRVNQDPKDPTAWQKLIVARWENAQSGGVTSGGFNAFGKQQLIEVTKDYEQYAKLVSKPNPTTATYAARAYSYLGNYAQEAHTWDAITSVKPSTVGYKCLALSAYAAKNTSLGQLAANKMLAHVPKKQRTQIQAELQQASTKPSLAMGC
ncbi:MAG TPA: hypothetical protein VFW09_19130 [Solirubrobacteraceae bacterium]|nr:hypothetical protein [Solirubrobacteraceae bacterium]